MSETPNTNNERSGEDSYVVAKAKLDHQVRTSYDLLEYSQGKGPLSIGLVASTIAYSEEFRNVVGKVDWPNAKDSVIEPASDFTTAAEFMSYLKNDELSDTPKQLSSAYFLNFLRIAPQNKPPHELAIAEGIGVHPVVARADVLAPEFFRSLRVVMNSLVDQHRVFRGESFDQLAQTLLDEEDQVTLEAMYRAYRIMSRLLKVEDHAWISNRKNQDGEVVYTPILNVNSELLEGF